MWPFKPKPHQTTFYDPKVTAIGDPAVREWVSRLVGRCDQLDREVAYCENVLNELRERLAWTAPLPGSPFTEGDRVARDIATMSKGGPKLEPPDPAA